MRLLFRNWRSIKLQHKYIKLDNLSSMLYNKSSKVDLPQLKGRTAMKKKKRLSQLVWSILVFVLVSSIAIFEKEILPQPQREAVLVLPIIPMIFLGLTVAQMISELDELQKRIQLEAFAFSLANTVLLALFLGLFQLSTPMSINLLLLVCVALLFWGIGFTNAKRRYQ
jgi:cytochrome c biogenesis protein CcdA